MSKIKSVLVACASAVSVSLMSSAFAAPTLFHHTANLTLSSGYCGMSDTAPTLCVLFHNDGTIPAPAVVTQMISFTVPEGTETEPTNMPLDFAMGAFVSDLKEYGVSNIVTYISSVNGQPVSDLCHINLNKKALLTPQQIKMTLHYDGNGHYSCQRS